MQYKEEKLTDEQKKMLCEAVCKTCNLQCEKSKIADGKCGKTCVDVAKVSKRFKITFEVETRHNGCYMNVEKWIEC